MSQPKFTTISAFTKGDITGAGSRLRSFYLFSLAEQFSLTVNRPQHYELAVNSNVIHIHKIYSWETLKWVIKFRLLGKRVVFDICDQVNRRSEFPRVLLIILFSSFLTVDNECRKKYWHKFFPLKKIIVLPDIADTQEVSITSIPYHQRNKLNSFFWIGNSPNFKSIKKFIDLIRDNKTYDLTVAMDLKDKNMLCNQFPHVKFYSWEPEIAFNPTIEAKFMILNHAIDKNSSIKSDNKMVLAILAGFIPLISRTPSYVKLAQQLNASFLIFDDLTEVPELARRVANELNPGQFFNNALKVINEQYSRKAVLSKFCEAILKNTN